MVLYITGRLKQSVWVIGTKLNNERTVFRARLEHGLTVGSTLGEKPRVVHRRVANVGAIFSREHSIWQFWLINHRRNKILGAADTPIEFIGVLINTTFGFLLAFVLEALDTAEFQVYLFHHSVHSAATLDSLGRRLMHQHSLEAPLA